MTIGNSVESMGSGAFEGCYFAKENFVNNSSLSAEEYNCWGAKLCDYETQDGLLILGSEVVYCRNHVDSVIIPSGVTSIGDYAFQGCSCLTSVTIPNSVMSIGDGAFRSCSALTSVTIPNSVTSIGDYAFFGCSGLTSVSIGNSVESIGKRTFYGCSELLDIYCYAENVPSTDSDAFQSSSIADATLHVPATSVESYQVTSPWSGFGKIVALTEEETGIGELKTENCKVKTAVYDLSGRRVQKTQKGVYIQNGKVVLVR